MHALPYWRLAGVYFFYFAYLGAFAPYFSLYLSSIGVAAAGIGVIMALPQLVRIGAPYLWGWLADRGGHRLRVARVCTAIGTAVYCGLFAAQGVETLFAIVLLMSFFLSAALPQVEITTLSHLGERSAGYGRVRVWGSLGFISAVLLFGALLQAVGMAWFPVLVISTYVLLCAATWRLPQATDERHNTSQTPPVLSVLFTSFIVQ